MYKYYQHKITGQFIKLELASGNGKEFQDGKFHVAYSMENGKWIRSHYVGINNSYDVFKQQHNEVSENEIIMN